MKKPGTFFKGQSMLEVLVALGAAVIILTSITVAVITSLSNATYSKNQNTATHYAQEGLDTVRKIRDSDFVAFSEMSNVYCLGVDGPEPGGCNRPNIDNFIREVTIQHDVNTCNETNLSLVVTEVVSRVSWADGKCTSANEFCHEVKLVSCLSDVISAPAL